MISIKRFMEQRRGEPRVEHDVVQASVQMGRLLLDTLTTCSVRGPASDHRAFTGTLRALQRRLDEPPSAFGLLEVSSGAAEALETYGQRTNDYIREQNERMQSMVAMLTATLADITGQSEASVSRLQSIEQQIERASQLDDIRALSESLQDCLVSVREAAAQQKKASAAMVNRLRAQFDHAQAGNMHNAAANGKSPACAQEIELEPEPEEPTEVVEELSQCYVAAFKLQRAEHIETRFGTGARQQMLALVSQHLKGLLGANDRLLRWKGTSFVMFLNSSGTLNRLRALLAETVTRVAQQYIEVGKNAALISVTLDWTIFPQAQCPSLDAVFNEVDAFLASETGANPIRMPVPAKEIRQ
jgi:GGDEF domain-containing protein